MKKIAKILMMSGVTLVLSSCGMFSSPHTASYVDPHAVNNLTTNFTMTDLQMVSQSMADSLITSGRINKCKTYTVSSVVNKTDQYIDTETITQSIVNKLGNSNAVKSHYVISSKEMQNQTDELDRQNQSGLYNNSTTAHVGKMKGAECRIDGFVNSIDSYNANTKTHMVQYQYNMKLINVEAGEMVWSNEKPLSKMTQY
jgi:penicillin-binding protein activator